MFMYTDEILNALKLLRYAGFAVCAFDPEGLGDVDPDEVEQRMWAAGWEIIEEQGS